MAKTAIRIIVEIVFIALLSGLKLLVRRLDEACSAFIHAFHELICRTVSTANS